MTPIEFPKENKRYRHCRGGEYTVTGFVRNANSGDVYVAYTNDSGVSWTLPIEEFMGMCDGKPRFEPVAEMSVDKGYQATPEPELMNGDQLGGELERLQEARSVLNKLGRIRDVAASGINDREIAMMSELLDWVPVELVRRALSIAYDEAAAHLIHNGVQPPDNPYKPVFRASATCIADGHGHWAAYSDGTFRLNGAVGSWNPSTHSWLFTGESKA